MPVCVVVGGQYGSEGKGKTAAWLATTKRAAAVARVGGPNSGHTVLGPDGRTHVFRQLPTVAVFPDTLLMITAGSYIDPAVLLKEIVDAAVPAKRLKIDPNAVIIQAEDKESEARDLGGIASTCSGTGYALARRVRRDRTVRFARNVPELRSYLSDVSDDLATMVRDRWIVLEGTQGYGLSVIHSNEFPYVTSRDTTAATFVAESGMSPLDVQEVVMVLRVHPIPVGGPSGPLANEISWSQLSSEAKDGRARSEFTSVTRKLRRVARFDPELVKQAIRHNRPSTIVSIIWTTSLRISVIDLCLR